MTNMATKNITVSTVVREIALKIAYLYPVAIVIIVWELVARSGLVPPLLWPSFSLVVKEFFSMIADGVLPFHARITVQRAMTGLGAAIVCGILLGTALVRFKTFSRLFEPLFLSAYPVPKIALYPVFIFIFGFGDMSKIVLIFLECLYPITLQTMAGVRSAEPVLLWTARNVEASPRQMFWNVLIPSALPSIFSGLRIAIPISLIISVVTEIVGESRGLGYLVSYSAASFEPARALAAVSAMAIIGFTLDRTFALFRSKLIFWQREARVVRMTA